jgi:polyisoprenoid-binding protein YceI
MKKVLLLSIAAFALISCGGEKKEAVQSKETSSQPVKKESKTYVLDTENSVVYWKGTMVGMYSHEGTLKFKEGQLNYDGNQISGGSFVVDMTTINPTDENYSEEHPKEQLVGHLSSPDFFDVQNYPTASFKIKKHDGNTIIGDLTIRGKTNEETVTDVTLTEENGVLKASGKLVFNRQKYDVSYQSTMKDMVLSDDIELKIEISAKAK